MCCASPVCCQLHCLFCPCSALGLRLLSPAGCPGSLVIWFPSGFGQWELLVLDWRAGGREEPKYFSPSLCFGLRFWQWPQLLWGHSSSWIGYGCGSSFPLVTLIPKLTTSSFCGDFLPLTIAGWLHLLLWPLNSFITCITSFIFLNTF